ncbi:hypothetical protein COO91_02420 [Nostoc flagelliforme CCNUN1]|uniref:Uncharacterized protein n=1 Tax=Nostoc flagelliforme CCNUN1 TaxID=2038116 RepID=A0A2K8SNT7_9NOSO|nr:hypothetical protein [Nostoc flagelliforme]AUB36505.1 hypothetical protein COO91_02420 [Nostoc flagelliforme CCNUN1]
MKPLALTSSLLAIVGSVVGLTPPAIAINVAYFAKTTQALYLPTIGGAELRLTQIFLPRGQWVINYSASPVNNTANDIVRCYVRARETGEILSIHATTAGVQLGASFVSTVSGVTLVNLSEPTTMVLTCTHDVTGPTPYIDPGAEIVAY